MPELGIGWPQMEDLQLSRNNLTGRIPSEWFNMHKLKRILLQ